MQFLTAEVWGMSPTKMEGWLFLGSTAHLRVVLLFFNFFPSQTVFISPVGRQHGFDEPVCPRSWKRFPPPALLPPGTAGRPGRAGRDAPRSRWPGKLGPRIRRRAGSRQGRGRGQRHPGAAAGAGAAALPCRRSLPGASRLFLLNSNNNNNSNNNVLKLLARAFSEDRLKT